MAAMTTSRRRTLLLPRCKASPSLALAVLGAFFSYALSGCLSSRYLIPQQELARLAQLPPDQRQALELAFFDGLTHVEIAQRTNVPLGTIKTRIRLGLLKVRDQLRPIGSRRSQMALASAQLPILASRSNRSSRARKIASSLPLSASCSSLPRRATVWWRRSFCTTSPGWNWPA